MANDDPPDVVRRLTMRGDLTRAEIEALLLELRQLAKQHGLKLRRVRQEKAEGE